MASWSLYCVLNVITLTTSATGLPEMSLRAAAWAAGSVGFAWSAAAVAGLSFAAVASCALYCVASDCTLGTMVGSAATALTVAFSAVFRFLSRPATATLTRWPLSTSVLAAGMA